MDYSGGPYAYFVNLGWEWKIAAAVLGVVLSVVVYRRWKEGKMQKSQAVSIVVLPVYLFLVYASTVFSRTPTATFTFELVPFWSYGRILKGQSYYLTENFYNVLMLIPVGLLVPVISGWGGKSVVLTGFLCSASIEILQLVTKRGLFEFDDMIHNTLGVAIGYLVYRWIHLWKSKKNMKG